MTHCGRVRPTRRSRTSPSPGSGCRSSGTDARPVKAEAARVNAELGLLDPGQAERIAAAAEAVAAGDHDDQFPIDVFQTGSGTNTNTNVNEVVAPWPARGTTQRPRQHGPVLQRHLPDRVHLAALHAATNDLLPALGLWPGRWRPRRPSCATWPRRGGPT